MEGERIRIPLVIGGKDVYTDETFESVMPHRKSHVLADVSKGGPEHVQQAIDAAKAAHGEWSPECRGTSAQPSSFARRSFSPALGAPP
jgi:1-pyrroline-5-carboxylate dehydrogenase